jgi:hypothetical protein
MCIFCPPVSVQCIILKTNTKIDALVPWSADFAAGKPIYEPLLPQIEQFAAFREWPGLDAYQQLLDAQPQPIRLLSDQVLKIVPQEGKVHRFDDYYAPRIYMTGEVQTRTRNWHDFFQFLTWLVFPRTKALINAIHIPKARARLGQGGDAGRRSPVENMLSLFDEGGAVVLSSDASLLQLIRDFRWKELFWHRRDEVQDKLQCLTFGHAMYEKGLKPYVGMTANCILLEVEPSFFGQAMTERLAWLDEQLAVTLERGDTYQKPKDLSPFPILGMPDWEPDNGREAYYDNTHYFRPGRRK